MLHHIYSRHIKDKSRQGYVVDGLPFRNIYDAETRCMEIGVTPDEDHLFYAPEDARRLANGAYREIEYLETILESMRSDTSEELRNLSERLEAMIDKGLHSIADEVDYHLLEKQIGEKVGYHTALCRALTAISTRKYELWEISRLERRHS